MAKALIIVVVLGAALVGQTDSELAKDPNLSTAVARLKRLTPAIQLEQVKVVAEPDLVLLLHGYGTWIRNQWIHANRDPELVTFFHDRGIDDPERISMILIQALWNDLNRAVSPKERATIEAKRDLVKRRRATYQRLEAECQNFIQRSVDTFEACYRAHGLPSENPLNRDPFFKLIVAKTGHVKTTVFFDGANLALKACLRPPIEAHTFSPFTDDSEVTLYITSTPACRVAERDTLYP